MKCTRCHGTGTMETVVHHGPDGPVEEPIRCEGCDGFGVALANWEQRERVARCLAEMDKAIPFVWEEMPGWWRLYWRESADRVLDAASLDKQREPDGYLSRFVEDEDDGNWFRQVRLIEPEQYSPVPGSKYVSVPVWLGAPPTPGDTREP